MRHRATMAGVPPLKQLRRNGSRSPLPWKDDWRIGKDDDLPIAGWSYRIIMILKPGIIMMLTPAPYIADWVRPLRGHFYVHQSELSSCMEVSPKRVTTISAAASKGVVKQKYAP